MDPKFLSRLSKIRIMRIGITRYIFRKGLGHINLSSLDVNLDYTCGLSRVACNHHYNLASDKCGEYYNLDSQELRVFLL